MNRIKLTITAFALVIGVSSFAQEMSAKEKKKLQKEMLSKAKGMDPVALKKMFDEYPNMESEINSLNSSVSSLEADLSAKDSEISSLKSELDAANEKIANMESSSMATGDSTGGSGETSSSSGTSSSVSRPTGQVIPGLVYKVQIGAFRDKDLMKYFEKSETFSGEVDADGTKKYTIGNFTEYWEANTFKKYMREMGVRDAWIVPYYNGQRISMKDAREGVLPN